MKSKYTAMCINKEANIYRVVKKISSIPIATTTEDKAIEIIKLLNSNLEYNDKFELVKRLFKDEIYAMLERSAKALPRKQHKSVDERYSPYSCHACDGLGRIYYEGSNSSVKCTTFFGRGYFKK